MEKIVVWVMAGLLAYICFVLTSINGKIEALNAGGAQVAVLSEVKPNSYRGELPQQVAYQNSELVETNPMQAGFVIVALLAVFVSWHISRIYHNRQWSKNILRKSFASFSEPHVKAMPRESLHIDQDCVGDPPLPDGRIKESWLPSHAKALYAGWGGRQNGWN